MKKSNLSEILLISSFLLMPPEGYGDHDVAGFTSNLTVTNNANKIEVEVFGLRPGFTDGLDAPDEEEQPPLPPSAVFDARFEVAGSNGSDTDIRAPRDDAEVIWTLKLQGGAGGYPLRIEWDNSIFPTQGTFIIQDAFGGIFVDVDMRAESSVELTNPALTAVKIVYSSSAATVPIDVSGVNDAPTATAQSLSTNEDAAETITLAGSDPDGDSLTYALASNPSHGSASLSGSTVTYTPTANLLCIAG